MLEAIVNDPKVIAKPEEESTLWNFAKKAYNTAKSGLDTILEAGKHAILAANPIKDIKNFAKATYNLVSEKPSWKEYKAEVKKGKWLGKGNLASVLFTTGAVVSGLYPSLLALRAVVGAGTYLGRKALTNDYVKEKTSSLVDKLSNVPAAAGALAGMPYQKTKKSLSKRNVKKQLDKLKDDKYYTEKVFPVAMEASIGVLGYAGIVGTKWAAGVASKAADGVSKYSKWKPVKWVSSKVARGFEFVKNAASDFLSASVFAGGMTATSNSSVVKLVKGEYNENIAETANYVASEDFKADASNYFANGKAVEHAGVAAGAVGNALWDATSRLASSTAGCGTYVFGGELADDVSYVCSGEVLDDIADNAGGVIKDTYYDVAEATGLNPAEKYAVVVSGPDHPGDHFVLAEQVHTYNQLLEMGFPKENIMVLTRDGYIPWYSLSNSVDTDNFREALKDGSYDHSASEENLRETMADMAEKVDGNDTFVTYVVAHGNTYHNNGQVRSSFALSDASPMSIFSWGRPSNNNESTDNRIYDFELRDMTQPIDAGLEMYVIESCHSGTFAKEMDNDNEIVISACRAEEPAWTTSDGKSLGKIFMDTLAERGGINYKTKPDSIITCLADASEKFKKGHIMARVYNQKPVVGHNNDVRTVAA